MRLGLAFVLLSIYALAQASGTLEVRVLDAEGGRVSGAQVVLRQALIAVERRTATDDNGTAVIPNVTFESYELRVESPGFAPAVRQVAIRSNVREVVEIRLALESQRQSVEVRADAAAPLVDTEATGTRAVLASSTIERMPVPAGTRGIEAALLSLPGFAANANGAIHPRGAHNQMTYVVDGMAISDQLTGAFANSIDLNVVQSVELYTGNIPAEYGSKVSGVAAITTPSGLGSGRLLGGSAEIAAGEFDALSGSARVAGERKRLGYFASVAAHRTHRYLDQVSLDNLHNGGNSERAFTRLDYQATDRDSIRLNLIAGQSRFELANLRSQHEAGQDQRQRLADFAAAVGWVRTLSPRMTLDATASYRTALAQLYASPADTPVTASQARHLTNISIGARYNFHNGPHTLRAGGDFQRFPVSEYFSFRITSPDFNTPGSTGYNPSLVPFDLSRGGRLFQFAGDGAGRMGSLFAQDTWKLARFVLSLGMRHDEYRFLAYGRQFQPRVGLAFHLAETGTVLRASYNRTYQTPPNENLLLSNSPAASALAPPAVREALGQSFAVIQPEKQNVYEAGLEQRLGRSAALTAVYYHKNSVDMQDNDNFFNTGIIFPTSLLRSNVNGAEARFSIAPTRGFSGHLSATHYHAVVTPPFTGGLFLGSTALTSLTAGPFVIDHDQTLGLHGMLTYSPRRGWWTSVTVRHDSGLVSNPSDPVAVARDPDYADLLPYVNLAGAPPRVRPRTLTDVAVGYERYKRERRLWEVSVQANNIANTTALYNFQSVFVGTRVVAPRSVGGRLRCYF